MSAFWWAFLAAMVWGIVPVFEKVGLKNISPFTGLFYRCMGVFFGMVLVGPFIFKPNEIKSADLRSIGFLLIGGFLASIVGQIFSYYSLKMGEISKVVTISGSYPFIAFLLGVFLFHESVSLAKAVGVGLILVGLWLLKIS
jgi:transporter family protein